MDKLMFSCDFPNLACCLQTLTQSRNNNKRPNKKNDVITDLGGEGDFPMFRFAWPLFAIRSSTALIRAAMGRYTLTRRTHQDGRTACIFRPTYARRSGHLARLDSGAVIPTVWAFQT
jgi:hypothetical protein